MTYLLDYFKNHFWLLNEGMHTCSIFEAKERQNINFSTNYKKYNYKKYNSWGCDNSLAIVKLIFIVHLKRINYNI